MSKITSVKTVDKIHKWVWYICSSHYDSLTQTELVLFHLGAFLYILSLGFTVFSYHRFKHQNSAIKTIYVQLKIIGSSSTWVIIPNLLHFLVSYSYFLLGASKTAAGDANQDRLEQDRVLLHRQGAEEPVELFHACAHIAKIMQFGEENPRIRGTALFVTFLYTCFLHPPMPAQMAW